MKKRIISLCSICVILGVMILSNVSVSEAKKVNSDTSKNEISKLRKEYTDQKVDQADLEIIVNGVTVALGSDIKKSISSLGKADDITESKVCIGSGTEKAYTYGDIVISALTSPKSEKVYMIEISGKGKLPSGIGIGSSAEDIIKIYGKEYTDEVGLYTYTVDDSELNFYFTDEKVDLIEIRSNEN